MDRELTHDQKVLHFLNRTGFGPTAAEVRAVNRTGIDNYLEQQLHPEAISDPLIENKLAGLKTIRLTSQDLSELYPPPRQAKKNSTAERRTMRGPRFIIFELQRARLLRAVYSKRRLFESMVDFWTNHFNVFAGKGADRWLVTSYDRDTIRPHALGRFRALLLATAQSPAMLFYLDNWLSVGRDLPLLRARQNPGLNRKLGLNENYARELLELHTLGVDGGYRQKDVEEVARCFTGWTVRRPRGEAVFRYGLHPALAPLKRLYNHGHFAIVHATGSPDNTRSHFDAQDYMEIGTPGIRNTPDGWLNRYLKEKKSPGTPLRAVSLSTRLPRILSGNAPTVNLGSIAEFRLHDAGFAQSLQTLYNNASDSLLQPSGERLFTAMAAIGKLQSAIPAAGQGYPKGPFGARMGEIARLITRECSPIDWTPWPKESVPFGTTWKTAGKTSCW